MRFPHVPFVLVVKTLVAAAALATLAGVAGAQLAPSVPLGKLLFLCAVGAAILFAVVLLATIASSTFGQFILRQGGTDPQWFWFPAEPPGLVRARKAIVPQSAAAHDAEA
jgi:hypothetical protein